MAGRGIDEGKDRIIMDKKREGGAQGSGIALCHISKSYGGQIVFRDLNLVLPFGRTACLMGPSGSGKTTLLRMLMGLEAPDKGRLTGVAGKKISAVFQEQRLCENLSASANIRMVRKQKPRKQDRTEIEYGMQALGLAGCERQPVREMSGGMRQRVALLRALYAEWEVLFLDEPFRGLDEKNKQNAIDYTRRVCEGRTVILVTHSKEEAEQMGEIFWLPALDEKKGCDAENPK